VCADTVRALTRDRARSSDAEPETPVPDAAEGVALRSLLDGLDPERREAFVLTQVVGLAYAEAADVVGCPVGTIRSRVARARADLIAAHEAAIGRDRRGLSS
jgi:RNA polymerase sigma-70 factor (ECF subfamily)